jgi:beta-galactosidase
MLQRKGTMNKSGSVASRARLAALLISLPAIFWSSARGFEICALQSVVWRRLVVDATISVPPPKTSPFLEGSYITPHGDSITLNDRYLLFDGKPWLPVMGEFHYTRVPENLWEEELLKMKADGIQIVSTYVIWIHQEEVKGQFDWSGRRNLRHFVKLCAKNGLFVVLRIGPWVHGEVRNGGFPNWLIKDVPNDDLRKDVPEFMSHVKEFYDQIGEQVKGLLWKDGGPIIGIQLDNEYAMRGPHAGANYILALKKLAIDAGLNVPLCTVTGWDNAIVPKGAVLPVYGGYMDAPWAGSRNQLPPNEVYAFRFHSRVSGGADEGSEDSLLNNSDTPFLTAELGGGIEDTYHRRPIIEPNDVVAMYPVMLGSGVNMYGTYMFQGGENPEGELTTLQESQITGYPNDVPVKSYDFQAPLGEFGQERESFRKMKVFNYFLNDFGDQLAPLTVRPPNVQPKSPADFSVPRLSVRTNGSEGFVFWNNYVRYYPMPTWKKAQVTIKLPNETLTIPRKPINIPSGAYFIWPFNFDLSGVKLKYSTAQLFTRLETNKIPTYFFVAIPGITPEFAFDEKTVSSMQIESGKTTLEDSIRYVNDIRPGLSTAIFLHTKEGSDVKIVVLTQAQAESAWKVEIDGQEHLLFTRQQFFTDGAHIYLQSIGNPKFEFRVVPELSQVPRGSLIIRAVETKDRITSFIATAPVGNLRLGVAKIHPAGHVPPVKLGPPVNWRKNSRVAEAPDDSLFALATKWRLTLPDNFPADVSELFLRVKYSGDIARLYSDNHLLDDNFYNGLPWEVGLKRFDKELKAGPLELAILPLRKDAPIFLEKKRWPEFPQSGQVAELKSLKLVPEYQLSIDANQ